jgi:sugar-specific transcriptional regulator TrmB
LNYKEEKVLTNLGLTASQAKVYLALICEGPSKIIGISKASGIHRAHLYEILGSLEAKGVVEKKLGTGMFTATPLKEAVPMLVKLRQQELSKIETEAKAIMRMTQPKRTHFIEDKPEIELAINRNRALKRGQKWVEVAAVQVDLMHTWSRFMQFWDYYEKPLVKALARGVVFRQIVEIPTNADAAQEFLDKKLFAHELFNLRFVCETGGNFAIIDNQKVMLSTVQQKAVLGEAPLIFSNYEGLLGLIRNYFMVSWTNAYLWDRITDIPKTLPCKNLSKN